MRSDPPRFVRPRLPRIESFSDRLESELREEMRRNPPRRRHRAARWIDRLGRILVRPVFHGGSVAVVFLFLFLALVTRPHQPVLMNDLATRTPPKQPSQWVEVIDVPDPTPKFVPFVARERAPRFVAFAAPSASIPSELKVKPEPF
jgi:hypothetical protein